MGTRKSINFVVMTVCLSLFAGCDDDDGKGGSGTPKPTATRTNTAAPTNTVPPGSTATPTAPAGVATPTATQGSGSGPSLEDAEAVISGILPSIVSLSSFGSLAGGSAAGAGGQIGGFPVPCPSGGTLTFSCGASGGGSQTSISFNDCQVNGGSGGPSLRIDGDFMQTTTVACFTPQPVGAPINVDFAGQVDVSGQTPISATFDMAVVVTPRAGGITVLVADGTVSASCVGSVEIDTLEEIIVPADRGCPTQGRLRANLSSGSVEILNRAGGAVDIDLGANGSVDSQLDECTDADADDCD